MIDRMDSAGKVFFFLALAGLYLWGSYASLHAGLTWDEFPELMTTILNALAVQGLLHGDMGAYRQLLEYNEKYYGIGFHVPAHYVIQLIVKPVAGYFDLAPTDAYMLSKHWVVFNLFFCSGILLRSLMRQITGDKAFSNLATIGFLLWPYVFGHAMINVKDVPFMFAWMLCTWYSFRLAARYRSDQAIGRLSVFLLAILTGWLISIRVAGVLVFVQYLITAACVRKAGEPASGQLVYLTTQAALFMFCVMLFVYATFPIIWLNPLGIFEAIDAMSHSTYSELSVCTRTFGMCMHGAPPASYIPLWLSVKLPVAILAGCLLLPYAFVRLSGKRDELAMRLFTALVLAALTIPILLMLRHTVLYNEIRHILFLMPFFYCAGVVSLYLISRKIAIASLLVSIGIFMADHTLAFPYQYIWFNEIARQYKVEKYFETDYWCASGRGLARQLTAAIREVEPVNCVYADPDAQIKPFMGTQFTGCFQNIHKLTPQSPRPYLTTLYSMTEVVVDCPVIRQEKFRLFLGKGDITVGWVRHCK